MENLKAGTFDGPQICKLMNDDNFTSHMSQTERNAWTNFVLVVKYFLGNHKVEDYPEKIDNMLKHFEKLRANMSIKVHFLHSHLDRFPDNLGDYSEEQHERFHQDIRIMEERYQRRWDCHGEEHARKSYRKRLSLHDKTMIDTIQIKTTILYSEVRFVIYF